MEKGNRSSLSDTNPAKLREYQPGFNFSNPNLAENYYT
jgi:hypothetical protein